MGRRAEMAEVIYDDGAGVRIDHGTATINGKTYSIQNINSVSVNAAPNKGESQKQGCGCVLIAGAVLFVLAMAGALMGHSEVQQAVGYGVIAAVLGGIAYLVLKQPRPPPTWRLVFTMSNGTVEAIASTNREAVDRVRSAIEEAIRGSGGQA